MKNGKFVVGLIQPKLGKDLAANLKKSLALVRKAAEKGAKIVCLPELYRTPYFPQAKQTPHERFAETIPGESTTAFARLARELSIVVIVPLFEKARERYFNSAAVIDADGTLLGTYRKVHIPHDPLFWEQNYFAPGDGGFKVFTTRYAKLSVLICYDQWFPEAARASALAGAEILFYPTAIGFIAGEKAPEGDWQDSWITIQRSHAIANSVHIAAVNRTGVEGKLRFFGSSFIADAFGTVLKKGSIRNEEIVLAAVDLAQNRVVREGWGFMRNRRPDAYAPLVASK